MVAMRDSSDAVLAVGRFAGLEPLGFEAGHNNWYRFVANGPTARTDPTGLIPLDTIWDIANIVYDIAVGDHVSLAADVAALAIPYVPAGSTKLVKAAKLADVVCWDAKAVRALKVEYQYLKNYQGGKHFIRTADQARDWVEKTRHGAAKFAPAINDPRAKELVTEALEAAKKQGKIKPQDINTFEHDFGYTIGADLGRPTSKLRIYCTPQGQIHARPVQ